LALTFRDILRRRLRNHRLSGPAYDTPAEAVSWLVAVQAQDYPAAKWALAQRMKAATDAALDQALADGAILRTHLLRPTWHFVAPADIHWLLALTAPRVNAANAYYYRKFELDAAVFKRSQAALAKVLRDGQQRTRAELAAVLERAGVNTTGTLRLSYLLMQAELDGLLCCGGRRGKQFAYALLEERAPSGRRLGRDEALAELARRYFASRRPATLAGFVWWSGLTASQARAGLEMAWPALEHAQVEGETYWFAADGAPARLKKPTVHLLPNYDEYTICARDRGPLVDSSHVDWLGAPEISPWPHALAIDGRIAGLWKRTFETGSARVSLRPFAKLTGLEQRAVAEAVREYGRFLGMPTSLEYMYPSEGRSGL
jgi:hypothetical protein